MRNSKKNSLLTCVPPKKSLSENKIVGKILAMENIDIIDYFLPAGRHGKIFILKILPAMSFPVGL